MEYLHNFAKSSIHQLVPIGVALIGGHKAPFTAHQIYQVYTKSGKAFIVRGVSVRILPDSGDFGSYSRTHKKTLRPDLDPVMRGMWPLYDAIERAAQSIDEDLLNSRTPKKRKPKKK